MKFYAVLPMWDYSSKRIAVHNEDDIEVGFIQRKYKNKRDKLIQMSSLPIGRKINLSGESKTHVIDIQEQSFKANLVKLKWDVLIKDSSHKGKYLLEDKTKISTNPRMIYSKNNKEYLFKKDLFNRICEVQVDNQVCAKIKIEKKIPMSLKISYQKKDVDLSVVELLGIYSIITLTY